LLIIDLERPAPPLQIQGARVEKVDGPRQWLRFRGPAAELTARVAAAARLVDLQITEPDIEEIVRRIYDTGSRDGRPVDNASHSRDPGLTTRQVGKGQGPVGGTSQL
jgi:hypothetical protein